MSNTIPRSLYADMYGPTKGDKVRLADTELIIEVEEDYTTYGEEIKFGGGKVIRDGMGQSQITRNEGAVDTIITNALILDISGIFIVLGSFFLFSSSKLHLFPLGVPFLFINKFVLVLTIL